MPNFREPPIFSEESIFTKRHIFYVSLAIVLLFVSLTGTGALASAGVLGPWPATNILSVFTSLAMQISLSSLGITNLIALSAAPALLSLSLFYEATSKGALRNLLLDGVGEVISLTTILALSIPPLFFKKKYPNDKKGLLLSKIKWAVNPLNGPIFILDLLKYTIFSGLDFFAKQFNFSNAYPLKLILNIPFFVVLAPLKGMASFLNAPYWLGYGIYALFADKKPHDLPIRRNNFLAIHEELAENLLLAQPKDIEAPSLVIDAMEAKDDIPPPTNNPIPSFTQSNKHPYEPPQTISPQIEPYTVKQERRGNPGNFGDPAPRNIEPVYHPRLILFKNENQSEVDKLSSELTRTQLLTDEKFDLNLGNKKHDGLGLLQFQREMNGLTIQYERKCFKVRAGEHIDVYPNLNFLDINKQKKLKEYDSHQHDERSAQEGVKREAEQAKRKVEREAEQAERETERLKREAERAEREAKGKAEQVEHEAQQAKDKADMAKLEAQVTQFEKRANPQQKAALAAELSACLEEEPEIAAQLAAYRKKEQQNQKLAQSLALDATGIFSPQHRALVSQRTNIPPCSQEATQ